MSSASKAKDKKQTTENMITNGLYLKSFDCIARLFALNIVSKNTFYNTMVLPYTLSLSSSYSTNYTQHYQITFNIIAYHLIDIYSNECFCGHLVSFRWLVGWIITYI
jgi:hypothetical protein